MIIAIFSIVTFPQNRGGMGSGGSYKTGHQRSVVIIIIIIIILLFLLLLFYVSNVTCAFGPCRLRSGCEERADRSFFSDRSLKYVRCRNNSFILLQN